MSHQSGKWEFWIDRGGTFTDVVAKDPKGNIRTHKLLSENSRQYQDAAIQGIRDILKLEPHNPIPSEKITTIKMGTTVATNALLERKGEPTLLVITKGFKDALRIGYQTRPDLFALKIKLPTMLYSKVVEIDERLDAKGKIIQTLDSSQARKVLLSGFNQGLRSVAIVLLHAYRYPEHELELARIATETGFKHISVSHKVSPLMKLVPRGDTTVADAYLSPILRRYIQKVQAALRSLEKKAGGLMFMQSNGGLAAADHFQGKDAILSGPAGGVVGMARVARQAGFTKVIGFDMGGTSTDVCHYNGEFARSFQTEISGVRLSAPMLKIHTVAAGGGSILNFDGARFRVGPESAGAEPGPACYRNGGPLTITDCNVILGNLQADFFPKVFGPESSQALDVDLVFEKFIKLAEKINLKTKKIHTPEQVAAGFLKIAVQNMANAIKKISVERGYDVSEYTLCCFGGAGGQHACQVADALGVKSILLSPFAGVLSAYGMGLADTVVNLQEAIESGLNQKILPELKSSFKNLHEEGIRRIKAQGADINRLKFRKLLHIRYQGSDTALVVDFAGLRVIKQNFSALHKERFGFLSKDKPLLVESIELEVIAPARLPKILNKTKPDKKPEAAIYKCYLEGKWQDTPFFQRDALISDKEIKGPAVIIDKTSTIVLEPGWQASLSKDNDLILKRFEKLKTKNAIGTEVDPIMLEIFNKLFMSIAEQMGSILENTAASVNIKERLDFSCAIFDPKGSLVANAPHMPVHLGSMSESIKTVVRERDGKIDPGDAYVLNAPYNGGTHLPDITIIKPVFAKGQNKLLFFVAARGHHADIGGITPGSAPAHSSSIEEEGVVIDNVKLVANDIFLEKEITELLRNNKWPARNPAMNIADFKAQLAACEKGAGELNKLTEYYGVKTVHTYMRHVQDNAEESVRSVLKQLKDGNFSYRMDDKSKISVAIKIDKKNRQALIDFSGTSDQHPGNYNAPSAVVRAAVLYVFRCLVADSIPLNDGCLKPLQIIIPSGSMLNPEYPAAVFAGNVETSQYIVDTLFGALKVQASAQGTMNNFIWGNARHQYYETICGGTGAGKDFAGTDAVHSHMTNSRLTDPEVLEWRFPVLLEEFSIRENSGGNGKFRGGNGVVRRLCFKEKMTANIISGHREVPPFALAGGGPGKVGINKLIRKSGEAEQLGATAQVEVFKGDAIEIATPGGGSYGKP